VRELLGEMTAAAVLMQANIQFDGALVLQIFGDGPVKVAVAEVDAQLGLRATATLAGEVVANASLSQLVNQGNKGRCAITLDPKTKFPGQQPYQGVVPLHGDQHEKLEDFSTILQHYMRQSEQLDTTLVLAANDQVAAGLLIQRMPSKGEGNLEGQAQRAPAEDQEDYNRISILASSLTQDELLTLDVDTILHRLFWEEKLLRFAPQADQAPPHFACNCSRERVGKMIRGLGQQEAIGIVAERGDVEVGCEFCGKQYRFDSVDVAQLFAAGQTATPGGQVH
jgi:molecular chaperone Hsp33